MGSLDGLSAESPALPSIDPTAETVENIKFVAYSVIAYLIVAIGMFGNLLSLVVLTRPNLKGVM